MKLLNFCQSCPHYKPLAGGFFDCVNFEHLTNKPMGDDDIRTFMALEIMFKKCPNRERMDIIIELEDL